MRAFEDSFVKEVLVRAEHREPDFNNLLQVLQKKKPSRPTLFEFFLNDRLDKTLSGRAILPTDGVERVQVTVEAFRNAGYDYANFIPTAFSFPSKADNHGKNSRSMTDSAVITDWESFEQYHWQEPEDFSMDVLEGVKAYLPDGMKVISYGPCGVLENVIALVGYENLCYMMADEPELVEAVFRNVGSRLVRFYRLAAQYDSVGALIVNDDWGFQTQTMLSTEDMRRLVFPWHKRIVEEIHKQNKPAILHSCGQMAAVYDDIIDGMKYDAKHSYEDKIMPVEEAYKVLHPRIAVLGGLDMDYVCRRSPKEIYERACNMLEMTKETGGYALGTGNSVPDYVPDENYFAMIAAAIMNE